MEIKWPQQWMSHRTKGASNEWQKVIAAAGRMTALLGKILSWDEFLDFTVNLCTFKQSIQWSLL